MAEQLHLVATNEGDDGFSLTSPQLPGFVYGAPTAAEFMEGLDAALAFADAPDLPRAKHEVNRFVTPEDREFTVRVASDDRRGSRFELAWRLLAALRTMQRFSLLDVATVVTGEVQFICVEPTDTLRWLFEQLDPRGDAAVIVLNVEDGLVWNLPIGHITPLAQPATSVAELGLTPDDTVGDLRQAVAVSPEDRIPVMV